MICTNCEGERVIHQPRCLYNDTYDIDDCDCKPTRCNDCKGEGIIIKNKKNKNKKDKEL